MNGKTKNTTNNIVKNSEDQIHICGVYIFEWHLEGDVLYAYYKETEKKCLKNIFKSH